MQPKQEIIRQVLEQYILPRGITPETAQITLLAATIVDDATPLLEVGRFFSQYGVPFQDFDRIAEETLGERPIYRP